MYLSSSRVVNKTPLNFVEIFLLVEIGKYEYGCYGNSLLSNQNRTLFPWWYPSRCNFDSSSNPLKKPTVRFRTVNKLLHFVQHSLQIVKDENISNFFKSPNFSSVCTFQTNLQMQEFVQRIGTSGFINRHAFFLFRMPTESWFGRTIGSHFRSLIGRSIMALFNTRGCLNTKQAPRKNWQWWKQSH